MTTTPWDDFESAFESGTPTGLTPGPLAQVVSEPLGGVSRSVFFCSSNSVTFSHTTVGFHLSEQHYGVSVDEMTSAAG